MEPPYPSAAADWSQFAADYIKGVTLKDRQNQKTALLLAPGNHDISNAIGFHRIMNPETDPTSMVQMYNLMLHPSKPKTNPIMITLQIRSIIQKIYRVSM